MRIELHKISPENHEEVRALAVRPDQVHLVASVDKSLADAYVWQAAEFRAVYRDGEPVGYVVIFPFEKDGRPTVNIARLMVDARFQGEGVGRETLSETLRWVDSFTPRPEQIRISTLPENVIALGLYKGMGFVAEGIEEGEVALYRPAD